MGLIYTTQLQNQSYPHANLSMLPYLLHRFIVTTMVQRGCFSSHSVSRHKHIIPNEMKLGMTIVWESPHFLVLFKSFCFTRWIWCIFCINYVIMTSLWRHDDVIAPHMLSQKNYNFDVLFICLYFIVHTLILFKLEIPSILTIYGHLAGNSNSLISHRLSDVLTDMGRIFTKMHNVQRKRLLNRILSQKQNYKFWRQNVTSFMTS